MTQEYWRTKTIKFFYIFEKSIKHKIFPVITDKIFLQDIGDIPRKYENIKKN